jgi:hypothetical protein
MTAPSPTGSASSHGAFKGTPRHRHPPLRFPQHPQLRVAGGNHERHAPRLIVLRERQHRHRGVRLPEAPGREASTAASEEPREVHETAVIAFFDRRRAAERGEKLEHGRAATTRVDHETSAHLPTITSHRTHDVGYAGKIGRAGQQSARYHPAPHLDPGMQGGRTGEHGLEHRTRTAIQAKRSSPARRPPVRSSGISPTSSCRTAPAAYSASATSGSSASRSSRKQGKAKCGWRNCAQPGRSHASHAASGSGGNAGSLSRRSPGDRHGPAASPCTSR